eukprot:COSAG03_NODE_18_length_21685_cov_15.938988_11_plen_98_part_00
MSGLAMVRARRQQQCCSLLVPVCQLAAVGHHASMQSPPSRARASQIEMSLGLLDGSRSGADQSGGPRNSRDSAQLKPSDLSHETESNQEMKRVVPVE